MHVYPKKNNPTTSKKKKKKKFNGVGSAQCQSFECCFPVPVKDTC